MRYNSIGRRVKAPIKAILFCQALLAFGFRTAFADDNWRYHQESDRFTNETYSFAQSPLPARGLYDNLRLEVVCKENKLQAVIDADSLIASKGETFDFDYQIDKNPLVPLKMQTFPDSKRRGFTEQDARRVIEDLLSGQTVFVRVNTMIRKVLSADISLADAGGPIRRVMADCGLNMSNERESKPVYNWDMLKQDFVDLPKERQQEALDKMHEIILQIQETVATGK